MARHLGADPYRLTIEFSDVVDLVPQSLVKVDDVSVGTVTDISVGPAWTAMVSVLVNRDVALPADAQARIRTTSLLGEKFVELSRPQEAPGAVSPPRIADGATIPLARTSRAAEVEEVLGALSLLLNGGGIAQIRTISSELNKALTGNEPEIRALLDDLDHLVGALDDRKTEITRALDEINRLSVHAERPPRPDQDRARRPRARASRSWRPSAVSSSTCCRHSTGSPASPPT